MSISFHMQLIGCTILSYHILSYCATFRLHKCSDDIDSYEAGHRCAEASGILEKEENRDKMAIFLVLSQVGTSCRLHYESAGNACFKITFPLKLPRFFTQKSDLFHESVPKFRKSLRLLE